MTLHDILGPEGTLAQSLPGYKHRPQQLVAATAIDSALGNGGSDPHVAFVEAPCGLGKGMSYLIPAARAIDRGKKVVVSTHTIGLQEQLFYKDIPIVQKLFPRVPLRPLVVKGRGNYLCKQDMDATGSDLLLEMDEDFLKLREWARYTRTGDKAECPVQWMGWSEIAAKRETCRNKDCAFYDRCFYFNMRHAAQDANLLVVNHAMLMSDLVIREQDEHAAVLPLFDILIVDESHALHAAATDALSLIMDSHTLTAVTRRLRKIKQLDVAWGRLDMIDAYTTDLFNQFRTESVERGERTSFYDALKHQPDTRVQDIATTLKVQLEALAEDLEGQVEQVDIHSQGVVHGSAVTLARVAGDLDRMFYHPEQGAVRYAASPGEIVNNNVDKSAMFGHNAIMEERRKNSKIVSLYMSPIEVGPRLVDLLWDKIPSVVLTSATLSTLNMTKKEMTFDYVAGLLGTPEGYSSTILDTPFDFKEQSLLYVPAHLPEPDRDGGEEYVRLLTSEIHRLAKLFGGRTFVLFTSRRMLQRVRGRLTSSDDYDLLVQGEAPANQLLDNFRRATKPSVLLGLATFWEGVDVQGEALSCVIIDKIPYAVPSDPMVEARSKLIRERGGDSFKDFLMPEAMLRLKQGFGRLIRTDTDWGVVAILDTRLLTKWYGKQFVDSLPPARRASKWNRVEQFVGERQPQPLFV